MRRRLALTAAALLAVASPAPLQGQVAVRTPVWPRADSVVAIGSARIGLRVYAWRDFMPSIGGNADGSPLMVNLQITAIDSSRVPAGLAVDSAWVRSPSGYWATVPSDEARPELVNGMDLMLRGGPRWPTDQLIEVLVRLRRPSGKAYYLMARRQPIGRTL